MQSYTHFFVPPNCIYCKVNTYSTQCSSCQGLSEKKHTDTWMCEHTYVHTHARLHHTSCEVTLMSVSECFAQLPGSWCRRLHSTWRHLAASALFCPWLYFFLVLFFFLLSRAFFCSYYLVFVNLIFFFWGLNKSTIFYLNEWHCTSFDRCMDFCQNISIVAIKWGCTLYITSIFCLRFRDCMTFSAFLLPQTKF